MSAVFVGGNWTNGRNCSPVYFNLNNAPSNSNINRLARLCCSIKSLVLRALFLAPWQKLLQRYVLVRLDPRIRKAIKKNILGATMKSYNVDGLLTDRETIKKALTTVCKSKKKKNKGNNHKYKKAQKILKNIDYYVDDMHSIMLATKEAYILQHKGLDACDHILSRMYIPKKCEAFRIKDGPSGKERDIVSVPLYPDQVVHQLIIESGSKPLMSGFYYHSYGSIPGKGSHRGQKTVKKIINRHNYLDKSAIKYIAKLDITKCYPSIPHKYIESLLRKKFRGWFYIELCLRILDSYHAKIVDGEKVGLSIGYSPSQWFCNFALTPVDYYIKHDLKGTYSIRYIDDMVLWGRNKKELHKQVALITDLLAKDGIRIKDNWQVYRFDYIDRHGKRRGRDLDFLGLRFFRDKTILRKWLSLKISRQSRELGKQEIISARNARSFMARIGWLRHCNSYNYYHKNIRPNVKIKKIKDVIRNEDRKQRDAAAPL